jgi:uncharacterized membrane protein YdjX (TVP38/TMEM64 family)
MKIKLKANDREVNPESIDLVRRFLTRVHLRAAFPYIEIGFLLAAAIIIGGREIEHHINAIELWITNLGPWGLIAFVGLFVLTTSFLFPDTILCIIAGALFGLGWGVVAILTGTLIASAIQFSLSRRLLRARIQRMLSKKPTLAAIQRAISHDEFRLQILLRLMPFNPATINYILGAAGVRFTGFMIASLAHTPNLVIEVYFGHVGKQVARLSSSARTAQLHDLVIIVGLVVCVVVMFFISRMARKAISLAVSETVNRDVI